MVRYCRLFNVFEAFSSEIRVPHVFSSSGIKVEEGFSVLRNLAVTIPLTITYFIANFFLKKIFKSEEAVKSKLRSKTYFHFFIIHLRPVLKSYEILPKYGKKKFNSLLGTMTLRFFFINNLFRNFLIYWFNKFWDIYCVWILPLKFKFPGESSRNWSII